MPDPVGGVFWYAVDDPYTSCYIPLYCGIDAVPKSFTGGSAAKFSWDSAWWVFNIVSNYAYLKYSYMMPEIRACQKNLESNFMALQPAVEKTAVELAKTSPTDDPLSHRLFHHARRANCRPLAGMAEHLITKYNDGYVRDINGHYPDVGYPEAWLRRSAARAARAIPYSRREAGREAEALDRRRLVS